MTDPHVERVRDALSDLYGSQSPKNIVEEPDSDDDLADVRVRNRDRMENALFPNGEWAAFHGAGYVACHVDCDEEYVDLREVGESQEAGA